MQTIIWRPENGQCIDIKVMTTIHVINTFRYLMAKLELITNAFRFVSEDELIMTSSISGKMSYEGRTYLEWLEIFQEELKRRNESSKKKQELINKIAKAKTELTAANTKLINLNKEYALL